MHKTVQSISKISFSEWKSIFIKVKERTDENNVVIISAGVGFFGFLAIFPVESFALKYERKEIPIKTANINSDITFKRTSK